MELEEIVEKVWDIAKGQNQTAISENHILSAYDALLAEDKKAISCLKNDAPNQDAIWYLYGTSLFLGQYKELSKGIQDLKKFQRLLRSKGINAISALNGNESNAKLIAQTIKMESWTELPRPYNAYAANLLRALGQQGNKLHQKALFGNKKSTRREKDRLFDSMANYISWFGAEQETLGFLSDVIRYLDRFIEETPKAQRERAFEYVIGYKQPTLIKFPKYQHFLSSAIYYVMHNLPHLLKKGLNLDSFKEIINLSNPYMPIAMNRDLTNIDEILLSPDYEFYRMLNMEKDGAKFARAMLDIFARIGLDQSGNNSNIIIYNSFFDPTGIKGQNYPIGEAVCISQMIFGIHDGFYPNNKKKQELSQNNLILEALHIILTGDANNKESVEGQLFAGEYGHSSIHLKSENLKMAINALLEDEYGNVKDFEEQLELILPGASMYKGFDRRIYVAGQFGKYMRYAMEHGMVNAGATEKQIHYFFTPRSERKTRGTQVADFGSAEHLHLLAIHDLNQTNKIVYAVNQRIINQISQTRQANGIIYHDAKPGDVIFIGADLMYSMPRSGKLYAKATRENINYGVIPHQKANMDYQMEHSDTFFALDNKKQGCQIFYFGGGELFEEGEHLVNLIVKNIDFLRENPHYKFTVTSIDKSGSQLNPAKREEYLLDIASRVHEKLGSPNGIYIPNIDLHFVEADFLDSENLTESINKELKGENSGKTKHMERIVMSCTSTLSNMHDGKSDEMMFDEENRPRLSRENQQQKLVQSAFTLLNGYTGKFIMGAALESDEVLTYKSGQMKELLGEVLGPYGLGLPEHTLSWGPVYGEKHPNPKYCRNDRHQLEFRTNSKASYSFMDEHGMKHVVNLAENVTLNITYSQRFNEQLLHSLVQDNGIWKVKTSSNAIWQGEIRHLPYAFVEASFGR